MYEFLANATDLTLIELALQEDLGISYYDATTALLVDDEPRRATAMIISKHASDIVVCGMPLLPLIAAKFGCELRVESPYRDGDIITSGATLMTLQGTAANLMALERTMLNFLRHLSAIASLTHEFVQRISHTQCTILDTRKTTPGWRHLEKYAVRCGGGSNHRQGLYDAVMIKDTHVDLLGGMQSALAKLPKPKTLPVIVDQCKILNTRKTTPDWRHVEKYALRGGNHRQGLYDAIVIKDTHVDLLGGMRLALAKLPKPKTLPVIVEVRNLNELKIAVDYRQQIDRILLDNMRGESLRACVQLCKKNNMVTEASGNLTLETVIEAAESGVDYASVGMLTHSPGQVDLSMKIT